MTPFHKEWGVTASLIRPTVTDAIVSSLFWSTAITSCKLIYLGRITEVVDN